MSQVPLKSALDTIEKVFKEYALEGTDPPMITKDALLKLMNEQLPSLMQVQAENNPKVLESTTDDDEYNIFRKAELIIQFLKKHPNYKDMIRQAPL